MSGQCAAERIARPGGVDHGDFGRRTLIETAVLREERPVGAHRYHHRPGSLDGRDSQRIRRAGEVPELGRVHHQHVDEIPELSGQLPCRGGVEDELAGHRSSRGQDRFDRDLELGEADRSAGDEVAVKLHPSGIDHAIGSGAHHDGVLPFGVDGDDGETRRGVVVDADRTVVHSDGNEGSTHRPAFGVPTHLAHHRDGSSQTGRRNGLVGSLPTGPADMAGAEDRLPRGGVAGRTDGQVVIDRSDNDDPVANPGCARRFSIPCDHE